MIHTREQLMNRMCVQHFIKAEVERGQPSFGRVDQWGWLELHVLTEKYYQFFGSPLNSAFLRNIPWHTDDVINKSLTYKDVSSFFIMKNILHAEYSSFDAVNCQHV